MPGCPLGCGTIKRFLLTVREQVLVEITGQISTNSSDNTTSGISDLWWARWMESTVDRDLDELDLLFAA